MDREQTIVFRPHPGLAWAASVFFGLLPIGFLIWVWQQPQKEPGDFGAMVGITLFLGACCLLFVVGGWYATRQTLTLTAQGVDLRTIRGGWTADWSDVTDLGWRTDPKGGQRLVLIATAGRVSMTRGLWGAKNVARIAEVVADRAPHLPPLGEIGLRPTDIGPQVFEVANSARGMKVFLTFSGLFLAAVMLQNPIERIREIPTRGPIDAWTWGMMGMSVVPFSGFGVMLGLFWRGVEGQARVRRLTVTDDALLVEWRDGRSAAIPWDKIAKIRHEITGWRLTTPEGDVTVGTLIPNYAALLKLVQERTGLASDDEPAAPSPDERGVRVWRYSAMYSALLWLPIGLSVSILLIPVLYAWLGITFERKDEPPEPIFALMLLASLWGMWRRRAGFVETDEKGIAVHGLSVKRLRWSELETRRVKGSDFLRFCWLSGRGTTLRLWLSGLDAASLLAEIEERTSFQER